jgi:superfamily II DNA/RNA helicase
MDVRATILRSPLVGPDSSIHDIFDALVHDAARNRRICADVLGASGEGRKILVLSERTGHIQILREMLGESAPNIFTLHGRLSRKARAATMARLEALPDSDSRILLATGKLIGEGFDHPES